MQLQKQQEELPATPKPTKRENTKLVALVVIAVAMIAVPVAIFLSMSEDKYIEGTTFEMIDANTIEIHTREEITGRDAVQMRDSIDLYGSGVDGIVTSQEVKAYEALEERQYQGDFTLSIEIDYEETVFSKYDILFIDATGDVYSEDPISVRIIATVDCSDINASRNSHIVRLHPEAFMSDKAERWGPQYPHVSSSSKN
ncbi:MAG: hypothetical protein ACE5IO_08170 [Thermoplasmata archaeon]